MNQNPQYFQSKAEYWFFFVSDNWLVVVGIWWGKHLAFLGRHVLLCWPGDWDSGCLGSMGFVITDRGFVSGGGKKRKKECLSDQRKSLHSHFDWSPRKDQAYTPLFTWNLFFFLFFLNSYLSATWIALFYLTCPILYHWILVLELPTWTQTMTSILLQTLYCVVHGIMPSLLRPQGSTHFGSPQAPIIQGQGGAAQLATELNTGRLDICSWHNRA